MTTKYIGLFIFFRLRSEYSTPNLKQSMFFNLLIHYLHTTELDLHTYRVYAPALQAMAVHSRYVQDLLEPRCKYK